MASHIATREAEASGSSGQKKPSMRAALLKLAKERFAAQQAAAGSEALVAPISPSPQTLVATTLEALCARGTLSKRGSAAEGSPPVRVLDLGCGDARWLTAACASYHCVGQGYDIDDALLAKGRAAIEALGLSEVVSVERRDFFEMDRLFRDGDLVVAYLFREGCMKLSTRLQAELQRGVVVCVGFELRGWRPALEHTANGLKVRVYDVGAAGIDRTN